MIELCAASGRITPGVGALWASFNEWSALNGFPAITVRSEFDQQLQAESLKIGDVLWVMGSMVPNLMLMSDYEQYFGPAAAPGKLAGEITISKRTPA